MLQRASWCSIEASVEASNVRGISKYLDSLNITSLTLILHPFPSHYIKSQLYTFKRDDECFAPSLQSLEVGNADDPAILNYTGKKVISPKDQRRQTQRNAPSHMPMGCSQSIWRVSKFTIYEIQ